ncbi:MAG: hypothetical protein ACRC9L_06690 [Brevinema sp.]
MDRDLRSINNKEFEVFFKESETSILSDSFWSTRLVQDLETSSLTSPYFNAYIAAQVFFGTRSFLSASSKIFDLISAGDVHHIFPKAYLRAEGIDKTSDYNQMLTIPILMHR